MIGGNVAEDQANGFLMPIAKQLEMACKIVSEDVKLQQGFNAVGFSQGGLFLRALAQTCPTAKMSNLVSVGGPQQVPLRSCPNTLLPQPPHFSASMPSPLQQKSHPVARLIIFDALSARGARNFLGNMAEADVSADVYAGDIWASKVHRRQQHAV